MRVWEYEYTHQGFIAEDHDHVSWDGGNTVDDLVQSKNMA